MEWWGQELKGKLQRALVTAEPAPRLLPRTTKHLTINKYLLGMQRFIYSFKKYLLSQTPFQAAGYSSGWDKHVPKTAKKKYDSLERWHKPVSPVTVEERKRRRRKSDGQGARKPTFILWLPAQASQPSHVASSVPWHVLSAGWPYQPYSPQGQIFILGMILENAEESGKDDSLVP